MPVYIIVFIIFASACFFLPAKLSILPDLVKKENILMANSFANATWTISAISGFTAGAFLIESFGIRNSLYINSLMYLLSASIQAFITFPKKLSMDKLSLKLITKDLEKAIKKSFFYELKEGISYLAAHKNAKFIVGIFFAFMSAVGSLYVVMIVFIQGATGSMTSSLGTFGIFLLLGFMAGSYVYGKWGQVFSRIKVTFASFLLSGIFLCLFTCALKFQKSFELSYAMLFLLGISMSPIPTSSNTIIHESMDENMRGRIFSTIGIIMNGGFLIFMFLSSLAAEFVNTFWVIIACSFAFSLVGIIGYLMNRKENFILLRTPPTVA